MALNNYQSTVAERLIKYVQVDTQSDPFSTSFPSTMKQKDLSKILVEELKTLGIQDVELDENGYVYANIPSNLEHESYSVCLCAHVDTSPDSSGTNVKPILHENWNGEDIILPDDNSVIISKDKHTYLQKRVGDDIITASGTTLLGADDKAGVAIIMDVAQYIQQNPEIKHGHISILFTPDEEVGRGVDMINMDKVKADFGYTLDGGERGHLEGENFYADSVTVSIEGVSAHPGYAKNKLVNAIKIASHFLDTLPKDAKAPEFTSGYEGFYHPVHIEGGAEKTTINFIIRSFDKNELKSLESELESIVNKVVSQYSGAQYSFSVKEQYRNMKEVLDQYPHVMDIAAEAYKMSDMVPEIVNIRGGTDGARLSFMGLPCPNIFTGEMGIHSKQEYCSVQDMEKTTEVCVNILKIVAERGK